MTRSDSPTHRTSLWMLSVLLLGAASLLGCGGESSDDFAEPDVAPWSKAFGLESSSYQATDIAAGASGNIALAGTFNGSIDFGAGELEATAQPSVFVTKLSAAGNHIWSGRTGGGDDFISSVALDRGGSAVVAGSFDGTVDFGTGQLSGSNDFFLARFGASGIPLWSKPFGTPSNSDTVNDVAVSDSDGSIYLTGRANGDVDLGAGPLEAGQWSTLYIAKLDAAGSAAWSLGFAYSDYAEGRKIAVDNEGNTIVVGDFSGPLDFGGGPLGVFSDYGIFVLKLNPSGSHVWSKGITTTSNLGVADIAVGPDGSVALAGNFNGSINFGGSSLTSTSYSDIFVVKLGADGGHRFSKNYGVTLEGTQQVAGVGVDGDGNIYVGGTFYDVLNFGDEKLSSVGSDDIFLAKLDPNGNVIQAGSFGDGLSQSLTAMAVDAWGNTVLAGSFYGTIDFGSGKLDAGDFQKLFVARLP